MTIVCFQELPKYKTDVFAKLSTCYMRFEDLTETVNSEVFSGDQPFVCGVCIGRFSDFLLLLNRGLLWWGINKKCGRDTCHVTETVPETKDTSSISTRMLPRRDFIARSLLFEQLTSSGIWHRLVRRRLTTFCSGICCFIKHDTINAVAKLCI